MNSQNINQEILLFTDTNFANREPCNLDTENKEGKCFSANDKLENACWDGPLYELLPEVTGIADSKRKYFIWQITSADNFLCLHLGAGDMPIMSKTSIDPCYFITTVNLN
jgi:hypothetical protein